MLLTDCSDDSYPKLNMCTSKQIFHSSKYEGESIENLKSAIKIRTTTWLSVSWQQWYWWFEEWPTDGSTILHRKMKSLFTFCVQCIHSFIHSLVFSLREAGLAGTRAQSCDRYGSGTLHPGQVLGGTLPLLSPASRLSHFRHQVPYVRNDTRDPSSER